MGHHGNALAQVVGPYTIGSVRYRVRAALTRYGIHVIDAPAETFASTVADTYLALKANGRL